MLYAGAVDSLSSLVYHRRSLSYHTHTHAHTEPERGRCWGYPGWLCQFIHCHTHFLHTHTLVDIEMRALHMCGIIESNTHTHMCGASRKVFRRIRASARQTAQPDNGRDFSAHARCIMMMILYIIVCEYFIFTIRSASVYVRGCCWAMMGHHTERAYT